MRTLQFIINQALPYRRYIMGMFIAICCVAGVETALPILIKQLIDMPAENISLHVWKLFFFYGVLQCLRCFAWALSDFCTIPLLSRLRLDIASSFANKLYNYSYTFFQNKLSGQLSGKLNDAVIYVPLLVEKFILEFIYMILVSIISLIILYTVQPFCSLLTVLWTGVFLSINLLYRNKILNLAKNYAEERSKFLGFITDYLSNILNTKIFVTKDFEIQNLQQKNQPLIKATNQKYRYLMIFYAVQGIIASIYALGLTIVLTTIYQKHLITSGDFALAVVTNLTLLNRLFQFSHILRDFFEEYGTVDQALDIFNAIPEVCDKPHAQDLKVNSGKICFQNIYFGYANRSPLFKNLSLTIEGGQKIGLVGYSGGGKSSLMNLLLRFYDVQQGAITIDGQNISDIRQDSLRQHMGLIPQTPLLFHRTIAENIGYGRINANESEIYQAAVQAGAHEFIEKLPHQYQSLVGERGLKLSGGQIQRIAIARIFLKNPPILILDEATSQLDSLTENDIQKRLWQLMQNKTVLVIAHRLSTLAQMDRIIVLKQGKIVQIGTHTELINTEGLYRILWNTQVNGFINDKKTSNT